MTVQEACAQAYDNGKAAGDAEGYARGKAEAFAESGDLISRKALLDVIAETAEGLADCDQQNAAWALRKYAARDIQTAPAVAAQPVKRGQWLNWRGEPISPDDYWRVWRCSECGNEIEFDEAVGREEFTSNYCPNCGARMDGGGGAEDGN